MNLYGEQDIQEVPLRSPFFHTQVERFLGANGLRMESLDAYYAFRNADGDIVAGAGVSGDVIKAVAVAEEVRSEGLMIPLVSRIISERQGKPLKVFTKPENQAIFESLGFKLLASAPQAILMENGRGLEQYCHYLRSFAVSGRCGVVVMNANPFTLGHRYLLDQAASQVDRLFVIPVKEDVSAFPYPERLEMIRAAARPTAEGNYFSQGFAKNHFSSANAKPSHAGNLEASAGPTASENYFSGRDPKNQFPEAIAKPTHADADIVVLEGSDYQISALTFPTYFLKDLSTAAETQMRLDLDLFGRWIAPALNASVRFVGSEPSDPLTQRYNELMREVLPLEVVEVPRLTAPDPAGRDGCNGLTGLDVISSSDRVSPITASAVRQALAAGRFGAAAALCPATSYPYLLAALAERALRLELDTPGKPGLVGPDGSGAHRDMDYATMLAGIQALRPFWSRMALASSADELRQMGIDAENAMMGATGGVNTHRGAIFCLGLVLRAWSESADNEGLMQLSLANLAGRILANRLKQNNLPPRGAMALALSGYRELFQDWLPFYRSLLTEEGHCLSGAIERADASERQRPSDCRESWANLKADAPENTVALRQRLLLRIMSTLDDTCVVHRVGEERAQEVKREAKALLEEMAGHDGKGDCAMPGQGEPLKEMCRRYAAEGISPGGAADMLALTIFVHSILN